MFLFKFTPAGNLFASRTSFRRIYKRFVSGKCVRVRFAPSPTGDLHLGGLRTALYNHLFARSQNGVTILRIEDTDLTRKVPGATEKLIEDLSWCGITYDEGPYFQSERKEIYKKYVQQLLDQGDAYRCFCSNMRLELMRREAVKLGERPKYDNSCRSLSKEEVDENLKSGKPFCIRFKLSSFTEPYNDLIHGLKSYDVAAQEGDPVIFKGDGLPTYHFANVVDDHLMNITHVLRGSEWLISTPKHILLYKAFKWDPPQFGHFPLLLNADGTKLSKRQNSIHVRHFKEMGYLPNSVINFIIRFGGGFGFRMEKDIKVYSLQELSEKFDITKLKSTSAQIKLSFLQDYNQAELSRAFETEEGRQRIVKEVQELVKKHFDNSEYKNSLRLDNERVGKIVERMKHNISNLKDFVSQKFLYLWVWESKWSEIDETYKKVIKDLLGSIDSVNWAHDDLNEFLKKFGKQYADLKQADVMKTLRMVLIGAKVGPSVADVMVMLSKEEVVFRLSQVLEPKEDKSLRQS